jgi:hypothetical protein
MIKVTIFHYFIGLINGDLTVSTFCYLSNKKVYLFFNCRFACLEHEKLISTKPTEVCIVGWGLFVPLTPNKILMQFANHIWNMSTKGQLICNMSHLSLL